MARKRPGLVAVRRVTAGVLIFLGMFVFFFGLGNGNRTIMLTGGALILLSLASRLVSMLRGSIRQWVTGVGRVVEVSTPPSATPYGRCEVHLIVQAPELPEERVIIREPRLPIDRWPYVGQELPIEVAADDVRNVRILWPDGPGPVEFEQEEDPLWADDQPDPVPAEPPGSHLDADDDRRDRDDLDLDLDGPPTGETLTGDAPTGDIPGAAGVSPADEGRLGRHVSLADEARRVPRPRPSPRPRPHPTPRSTALYKTTTRPADPDVWATYPGANPAPSGSVHRVGVTLLVRDLQRSVGFYRDTLGFHEVDRGPDTAVLASGETRLVLHASADMTRVNRRVTHLNLDVADIDTLYADLREAGIRFTYAPRPVSQGLRLEQWAAAFRDPDGHGIALTEWRAPTGSR